MDLVDIIRRYGAIADYRDPVTGTIYHLRSITSANSKGERLVNFTRMDGAKGKVIVTGLKDEEM